MPRRERNKFVKRGETVEILIEDYAFGGKGIGRIRNEHGEFVVFVPNTLPGQLVKAQVKKSSKKYAECKLLDVLKPSEDEIEMPYQDIPGAPYIQLPIDKQQPDNLITFAQSIEGRNYIKENYSRRKRMIKYFNKVKKEAQALIEQINTSLEAK